MSLLSYAGNKKMSLSAQIQGHLLAGRWSSHYLGMLSRNAYMLKLISVNGSDAPRRGNLCLQKSGLGTLDTAVLDPGLYVVGTPIGNLEDISFRAIRTLKSVDRILCEDTRHTRQLLNHFDIHARTESFHKHNEFQKQGKVIDALRQGQAVALVSDAGMPGINDPGSGIIAEAARHGINIVPVPGPSAFLSAVCCSGLLSETFTYCGFVASKSSQRTKQFGHYKKHPSTLVFYVSPHGLVEGLRDMVEVFGGTRRCCVAREITKVHEEFIRSTLSEALEEFEERQPRGEFTLVVEGCQQEEAREITDEAILSALELETARGATHSAAAKLVSQSLEIPRKRVYELSLQLKNR